MLILLDEPTLDEYFSQCSASRTLFQSQCVSYNDYQTEFYSPSYIKKLASRSLSRHLYNKNGFVLEPIYFIEDQGITYIRNSYEQLEYSRAFRTHWLSYSSINARYSQKRRFGKSHNYYNFHGTYVSAIDSARLEQIPTDPNNKTFVILWHEDHTNYWHFIFEVGFRLFLLKLALGSSEIQNVNYIVVGEGLTSVQSSIIEVILGFMPHIKYYPNAVRLKSSYIIALNDRVLFDRLLMNRYAAIFHQSSILMSQDFLEEMPSNDKIYISRGVAKNGRNISNIKDLLCTLDSHNFNMIDPGIHTFNDQYYLFSNCHQVIGSNGAAFANALFMKDSFVIELCPHTYPSIVIYLLVTGLNNSYLRIGCSNYQGTSDIICNIDVIERALSYLKIRSL